MDNRNYIYMVKVEYRNKVSFKIGFTTNLNQRMAHYVAHNPNIELVCFCRTNSTSKMNIEKKLHNEIEKKGYAFDINTIDNSKTEWFTMSYDDVNYNNFSINGLSAFNTTRKNIVYFA